MVAAWCRLERAGEGRGRERERVEQAGEFGSVYSCTWGEVVSIHERGEPREPRGVETLCTVGLAASADKEGKKSNTTSDIVTNVVELRDISNFT